jgi:PEGA domain
MRSIIAPASLLTLVGLVAIPAAPAQPPAGPLCAPGDPQQDRYVEQCLGRSDLQGTLEGWEHQQGLSLAPEARRALVTEYLCEEYRQIHARPKARESDVRAAGQNVLRTYLAALSENRPKVSTLSSLFGQSFGDSAWRFPKPRKYMLLLVVTRPPQAQVEVDGLPLGSNKKVLVLPGRHHLTAACPGYQTSQRNLEVSGEKNLVVDCVLQPSKP